MSTNDGPRASPVAFDDTVAVSAGDVDAAVEAVVNLYSAVVDGMRSRLDLATKMIAAQGDQLAAERRRTKELEGIIRDGKAEHQRLVEELNAARREQAGEARVFEAKPERT